MSLPENLIALNKQIAAAASGRPVRLMAVSKNVEPARITLALEAGQTLFGENYVQEAKSKWAELRPRWPSARLNLIGPLQTNKAIEAVKTFDRIDSLDRPKLAEALADAFKKTGRAIPLLIEVNIGREPQKYGCAPEDVAALLVLARELHLTVEGLMAIPPAALDPVPFFKQLTELARRENLKEISMGMSGDFESAIPCGSTLVRLGTAIFGARNKA